MPIVYPRVSHTAIKSFGFHQPSVGNCQDDARAGGGSAAGRRLGPRLSGPAPERAARVRGRRGARGLLRGQVPAQGARGRARRHARGAADALRCES